MEFRISSQSVLPGHRGSSQINFEQRFIGRRFSLSPKSDFHISLIGSRLYFISCINNKGQGEMQFHLTFGPRALLSHLLKKNNQELGTGQSFYISLPIDGTPGTSGSNRNSTFTWNSFWHWWVSNSSKNHGKLYYSYSYISTYILPRLQYRSVPLYES